jgi:hypothetical protein
MKPRNKKLPPFVPLIKDTMKKPAWRSMSHGARSLYAALRARYNTKLQNAVYLATREAEKELGSHSNRRNIMRWFRELNYYGFIRMVSPAHHGVNGHGKAPHYRLTEEFYLGQSPTRDYLNWSGEPFHEQKSPKHYLAKNRSRGADGCTSVVQTGAPILAQSRPEPAKTGADGGAISEHGSGADGGAITSLTTPSCESAVKGDGLPWSTPQIRGVFGAECEALLRIYADLSASGHFGIGGPS